MIFLLIYTVYCSFKMLNHLIVFLNIMYIWTEIKLAVYLSKWPQFALWNVLIACVIQSNPDLRINQYRLLRGKVYVCWLGLQFSWRRIHLHIGKDAAWISKLLNSKETERREEKLFFYTKGFKKGSVFVMHVCSMFC